MSNQTTVDKLHKLDRELKDMKRDVGILRSFAISIAGKDLEGEYRPEFVHEILRATKEKAVYKFTTPKAFLKDIERAWFKSSIAENFLSPRNIFQNRNSLSWLIL